METFIALLMERVSNEHAHLSHSGELSLVRAMAINVGRAPEHLKGNNRNETNRGIKLLETFYESLEVKDTIGHLVDKMGDSKNNIALQIGGKGSRQHKRPGYFHKVMVFSLSNPILPEGVSIGTLMDNPFG